jgi:hypothetical protein
MKIRGTCPKCGTKLVVSGAEILNVPATPEWDAAQHALNEAFKALERVFAAMRS